MDFIAATTPTTPSATTSSGETKTPQLNAALAKITISPSDTKHNPLLLNFAKLGGFDASPEKLELFEKNCVPSSLGIPFVVISKISFVAGHTPGNSDVEFKQLVNCVLDGINGQRGSVYLADFEGEMPGFGGDLTVAQFLTTSTVERDSLVPKTGALGSPPSIGLLLDLRDVDGIAITRLIMGDSDFTKLIWGASGDLTSLRYQYSLQQIFAKNVVDVQRGFSIPGRLLGMATATDGLPYSFTRGLPAKDQGHDWTPRARNCRCVALPLNKNFSLYAMDDLHRIEAIISFKKPTNCHTGSYTNARSVTTQFLKDLEVSGGAMAQVENEYRYFQRKYGMQKKIKAVELIRVLIHIQKVFEDSLSSSQKNSIETMLRVARRAALVNVPADLSFY